ncbi:MAG: L,D-transpeptidase family protein [Candidatus Omnitrophota bacterium]
MDRRAVLILFFIAVVLASGISFLIIKLAPEVKGGRIDRSRIIYDRAEEFLNEGEPGKAINAFIIAVKQYPDSQYAERSLRRLALMHHKSENYPQARYYYQAIIDGFPETKDADQIKSIVEDLNMKILLSPEISEDSVEYEVQRGDSLFNIAKKFNTTVELIKKMNDLKNDTIKPGQKLKINIARFYIIVDKSDNILTLEKDGKPFKAYVVSTGKDNSTPVGIFKIEEKMVKPVWYKVGAVVSPDSEKYELGERWMGLSVTGYGIHGTSDESTIGKQITQGCVRMRNNEVVELYEIVPSGTEVEIKD